MIPNHYIKNYCFTKHPLKIWLFRVPGSCYFASLLELLVSTNQLHKSTRGWRNPSHIKQTENRPIWLHSIDESHSAKGKSEKGSTFIKVYLSDSLIRLYAKQTPKPKRSWSQHVFPCPCMFLVRKPVLSSVRKKHVESKKRQNMLSDTNMFRNISSQSCEDSLNKSHLKKNKKNKKGSTWLSINSNLLIINFYIHIIHVNSPPQKRMTILPIQSNQCLKMDVSENSDTPKSSILIRFSIINHPFWGTHMFGNTQMFRQNSHLHGFVPFFTIIPRHWWYFSGIKPKPRGWIRNRRSWEVWKNTNQIKGTWNLKHLFINGCFNWMIPNHYIKIVVSPNIHLKMVL